MRFPIELTWLIVQYYAPFDDEYRSRITCLLIHGANCLLESTFATDTLQMGCCTLLCSSSFLPYSVSNIYRIRDGVRLLSYRWIESFESVMRTDRVRVSFHPSSQRVSQVSRVCQVSQVSQVSQRSHYQLVERQNKEPNVRKVQVKIRRKPRRRDKKLRAAIGRIKKSEEEYINGDIRCFHSTDDTADTVYANWDVGRKRNCFHGDNWDGVWYYEPFDSYLPITRKEKQSVQMQRRLFAKSSAFSVPMDKLQVAQIGMRFAW